MEKSEEPGTEVTLLVENDNLERNVTLTLAESPNPPHGDDDAQLLESYLSRTITWRRRAIDTVGKNHELVKHAARDAVEIAKASAVRVFANHRQVALGTVAHQDGLIITKLSEVLGAERLTCRLADARRLPARGRGQR